MPRRNYAEDPELTAFQNRLRQINSKPLPQKLLLSVSPAMVESTVSLLLTPYYANKIKRLAPGEAFRIKKSAKCPRSVCVLRDPDGELRCILETKSKDPGNNKREIDKFEGGTKRGKGAWRLDGVNGNPQSYISLVETLEDDEEVEELRKQVTVTWELPASPYIQRPVMGALYKNKHGLQQSYYAPLGIPLDELSKYEVELTSAEKASFTLQLLSVIELLHDHGYQHQDIKPNNILLLENDLGNKHISLIDFELLAGKGYKQTVHYSHDYESPECATLKDKYLEKNNKKRKSLAKRLADLRAKTYKFTPQEKIAYNKPHNANDVFALGVTLYQLWNDGKLPESLDEVQEPILSMLNPIRSQRPTIAQSKAAWEVFLREQTPMVDEVVPVVPAASAAAAIQPEMQAAPVVEKMPIVTRAAARRQATPVPQTVPVQEAVPVQPAAAQPASHYSKRKGGTILPLFSGCLRRLMGNTRQQVESPEPTSGPRVKRQRLGSQSS